MKSMNEESQRCSLFLARAVGWAVASRVHASSISVLGVSLAIDSPSSLTCPSIPSLSDTRKISSPPSETESITSPFLYSASAASHSGAWTSGHSESSSTIIVGSPKGQWEVQSRWSWPFIITYSTIQSQWFISHK